MIIINMIDGEKIEVHQDTILVGFKNLPRGDTPETNVFYLQKTFVGTREENYDDDGCSLGTSDERNGIGGFLLSHDLFTIGEEYNATMYFTSAVKSISII